MERQREGAFGSRRYCGTLNALSFSVALVATLCKLPTAEFAIYGHGCEEDCLVRFEFKATFFKIVSVESRSDPS